MKKYILFLSLGIMLGCEESINKPESVYYQTKMSDIFSTSSAQLLSSQAQAQSLAGVSSITQNSSQVASSSNSAGGGVTQMLLTASTSTCSGAYAPSHITAIWVENSSGAFVRALNVFGMTRFSNLKTFKAASKIVSWNSSVDGYAGATRNSFGPVYAKLGSTTQDTWDLLDKVGGTRVPNGNYNVKFEMACQNNVSVSTSVPVVISNNAQVVNGTSGAGFTNIKLEFK